MTRFRSYVTLVSDYGLFFGYIVSSNKYTITIAVPLRQEECMANIKREHLMHRFIGGHCIVTIPINSKTQDLW
jgi:hypothetical protein